MYRDRAFINGQDRDEQILHTRDTRNFQLEPNFLSILISIEVLIAGAAKKVILVVLVILVYIHCAV